MMISILVACVQLVAAPAVSGSESRAAHPPPAWIAEAPLWKVLPVKDFATLAEGTVRNLRWGVYAYAGKGPHGRERPCIQEVDLFYDGSFATGSECGRLSPPESWPVFTLTGFEKVTGSGKRVGGTVVAMTLDPSVVRATVDFGDAPDQTRRARSLTEAQARKAHVEPFNYLAFDYAREACFGGVTGFDAAGVAILESPHYKCGSPVVEEESSKTK